MKDGDSHYWGVWWGMEPFEIYNKKIPRFMSEFGFQGLPDKKTIEVEKVKPQISEMKTKKGTITFKKLANKEASTPKPIEKDEVLNQPGNIIQVGAFLNYTNAKSTLMKLKSVIDHKCLIIFEDGFYKVRVTGFSSRIEAASYVSKLVEGGFDDVFVVVHHIGLVIQVDAFINQDKALAMQKRLIAATGRTVSIVFEAGLFNVRIPGFSGHNEAESFVIRLLEKGYPGAIIIGNTNPEKPR